MAIKFLTKNLPVYTNFIFRTSIEFSKTLFSRYKTSRVKFEEEHIDKIINLKRRWRKFKIQLKVKSKDSEKIKKLRDLKFKGFLIRQSIKVKSGLNNLNLIKEKLNPGFSLNSLKTFNTNNILPKLNKLNQSLKKIYSLLSEYVKTAYQLIDKTIHSPKFNKFLILVFFLFGAVIVEDQLDKIKITQKVPGDEKAVNINATADTDLVFEYDYELTTKTKILKYIIHPAFASDENQPQLVLTDHDGKKHNPEFIVDREGEKSFSVRIAQNKIPPGAYEALLEVYKDGVYYQQEKEFTYGVLSVNTNKATFTPGEEITLNMGALKYDGHTICDADLELKITSPSGKESNPEVKQSGFCDRDNVTSVPDYLASHKAEEVGKHKMILINKDNGYEIEDYYEVESEVPYSVERKGPSRIYPFVAYPMEITVTANQDFSGEIIERVPKGFLIKEYETSTDDDWQKISWKADLKKGDSVTYTYFFDAPDISPFLYLTGPMSIGDYEEARMWQIASDADGSGAIVVTPTVVIGGTANTLVFTYDPTEDMNSGELAIKVPTSRGWSTPQGSSGTAGYVTASATGTGTIGTTVVTADATSEGNWTLGEDDSDACNLVSTPYIDTSIFFEGTGSAACDNAGRSQPDDTDSYSYTNSGTVNWSAFTELSFWLYSTKALTSTNGVEFGIDDTANMTSPIQAYNTGTVAADTWTYVKFSLSGTRTAVRTFGLISNGSGFDSANIRFDEVMVGGSTATYVANGADTDIRLRFIDLLSTENVTVTYGAGGGASSAIAPSTGGTDQFTTRSRTNASGALTNLSAQPSVQVLEMIDISGTCKQENNSTDCTDTGTVRVAFDGVLQAETQPTVAGTWTISNIMQPATGTVITVFIDGAGEADEAVAVTTFDGAGDVTGVELIEQRLTIGNADNRTITNANLSHYDNSVSADEDIFYEVDASNDLTLNDTSKSSAEIYIKSGNTYRPDSVSSGNVTTKALRITGTFTADGNTITLTGGNTPLVTTGGTLNENTSTFRYTSSSSTTVTSETYYHLNLQPSSAGGPTYTLSSGTLATRNFTIGDATNPVTIDWTTSDPTLNIGGDLRLNANTTWIKSDTATMTFNGATTPVSILDNNSTKSDLGKVTIDGPKTVNAASMTVETLNITSGDTVSLGSFYTMKITGSGTPLVRTGTLSFGTSPIVEYLGTSSTVIASGTYANLKLNQTGTTFSSNGFLNVSGVFTIEAGTFDAGANTIDLTGSGTPFVVNGTFTESTSTINYNATTAQNIIPETYNNLAIAQNSIVSSVTYTALPGTIVVNSNLMVGAVFNTGVATFDVNTNDTVIDVGGNFLINSQGSFSASSNHAAPLSVAGNFQNNSIFSHNNGKVILDGAVDTSQTLNGTVAFHTLEIATGDREIKFGTTGTKSIISNGSFTLTGTDCTNMMRVRSSSTGAQADLSINLSASASVSHVDLQDINLQTSSINAGNSVNSGNNSANWTISPNGCIGTSTNQDTTGSSFQRKVIYDDQNSRYWSFNHDGDEIEVKYSSDEGSTWTNPATTASGRLPYDTNDFSVWWRSISTVEYVVVAVADGGSIKLRQGTLSGTDVTWDTDVSLSMDETGTYSRPYVSFDSANHIWVGATYNDGSDYVYKTVVSAEAASTDPSTWTWTTTPYQLSNAQTSLNVYGTLTALSSEDMYATFVVDTGLLGCRWDDSDTMWEDGTGASCLPTIGGGGESEYFDSLEEGLVGYWKMNEVSWNGTSGEVVDQTLNNYDGTRIGDATTISSGFGKSGTFDGTGDYVTIPSGFQVPSQTGTVSAWVYPVESGGSYDILSSGTSSNDFRLSPVNNLYGFFISSEYRVAYATDPTQNAWTLVTLTWDQTNGSILYFNGVRVAANSTPPPAYNQTGLKIASNTDGGGDHLQGRVDDVRAYSRALTSEEVAKLYQLVPESVNIDDTSDFGLSNNLGKKIVRTASNELYAFLNDSGNCEIWKSSNGIDWNQQQSGTSITCTADKDLTASIDNNQNIHVAYLNGNTIRYRFYDTSSENWDVSGEQTIGSSDTYLGPVDISLAIDSNNIPHVSFRHNTFPNHTILYNNRIGGNWNTNSTAIEVNAKYLGIDIAINQFDIPEISYMNTTDSDLTAAVGNQNDATSFTKYDIDTSISLISPSLAIDTLTGNSWIAYIDDTNNYLSLAKYVGDHSAGQWDGTYWTTITTNINTSSGLSTTIAGNGYIYVIYINDQSDVVYDFYDGTDWAGETLLHTGTYTKINTKSAFEWNNYGPNKIDYIYSDGTDVYYNSLYLRRTPTNIDDASDFNSIIDANGRQILRTSSGILYAILLDTNEIEVWKSIDNGYLWNEQDSADKPTGTDASTKISIAIDSKNVIHIVYSLYDVANFDSDTLYRTFDTTSDQYGSSENVDLTSNDGTADVLIALDSSDNPHIVYQDNLQLGYTNRIGGSWKSVVQVENSSNAESIDFVISDEDVPEIVYIYDGEADLTGARANQNDATSFTLFDIDATAEETTDVRSTSIGIDSSGNTWISYVDSDGTIRLAKNANGTQWDNMGNWTFSTNSNMGKEPSLAVDGTDVYVFYQDDQEDIVYDKYDSVAQTWGGETVIEMHGALKDVKPRWSYINNYDSTGVAALQTNTYYFDASDNNTPGIPDDPDSHWNNDAYGFNGSLSNYADSTGNAGHEGSESQYYLHGQGTNAPTGTGTVSSVKVRVYARGGGGTIEEPPSINITAKIYSDGLGETLGTINKTGYASWSDYVTLNAPSGGWDWNKVQALETKVYTFHITGQPSQLYKIEILVESTNNSTQSEIDYLYSDGTDVFYNRLSLGVSSVPGVQDSIVTGLSTGLHKNISTVGQTISTIDYVHLAYVNSSGNIYYDRYDGDWDFTNASLDANTDNTYLGLSKDTATNDVYLGYIGSTSDDIFTKKATYSAGPNWSWGTSSTLVTDATEIFTNYNANNTGNGKVGAIYSIGDLSPYNIGWETVLSGTTNNAPTVSNIVVNGGSNISLTSGSTHNVSWTATITDLDGNAEIAGVTGKLYRSGVAGAEACTPDNNNCYADAVCDLTGCSGNTCTATCTSAMYFHADATDANSTMPSEYWRGWMEATDSHSDTGSEFSATNAPDVESLSALDIVTSIDYGLMLAGDSSSEKTTLVTNEGNIILDLELLGDSMCTDYPTCAGDSIAVGQQEYSMSTFTYGSGTDLTSSAFRIQFNLAKPTSSPSSQTKNLYWRLGLDPGQDVGVYDGMNTVLAKNDNIP